MDSCGVQSEGDHEDVKIHCMMDFRRNTKSGNPVHGTDSEGMMSLKISSTKETR